MSKETEIKFRIADVRALTRSLKCAGFRLVTPSTHEMNALYDLPGQKLRKRGEMLRLRQYGREWVLTHKAKGTAGRHKVRMERETRVEDGQQMDGILRSLGFTPTFRYEKYRAVWSAGAGHVVVDETPIGNFGEIEGAARWIDRTAKGLGIAPANYITQTYASIFFAWKRRTGSRATEMTFRAVCGKSVEPRRTRKPSIPRAGRARRPSLHGTNHRAATPLGRSG
jgi:adenylate cyclase, class 2